jgi:hypothetical protein
VKTREFIKQQNYTKNEIRIAKKLDLFHIILTSYPQEHVYSVDKKIIFNGCISIKSTS